MAIHHGLSRVILHTTLILKAKSIWLAVRALSLSLSLSLSFSPENIPASTGQWALLSWVRRGSWAFKAPSALSQSLPLLLLNFSV